MTHKSEHTVSPVTKADHTTIIEVWEASVRATHHFISEEWIVEHKPLILEQYLDMVELACIRDDSQQVVAFLGCLDGNVEMLFVHPNHFRKGLGKLLMLYAMDQKGAIKVDVNEDNPEACKFYQSMGFEVISRSEIDGQGNPYPILHMILKTE